MGISPTTMSVAKALSSAYQPISAVLIPEFMYEPFIEASGKAGLFGHGFTYSGHPVCAAVALRTLEIFEERDVFAHVARVGEAFQERLQRLDEHPLVGNVRGAGLIGGAELMADKEARTPFPPSRGVGAYCNDQCEKHGLILRNLGDTMAICPPLVVTDDQVGEIFDKLQRALDDTLNWVN